MLDRNDAGSYAYISTATTTQVKSGTGVLKRIIVGSPVTAGTITIVDNTAGSTAMMVVTSSGAIPFVIDCDLQFALGLRVITTEAQKVTLVYS
jgi:hypothetical protein